MGIRKRMTLLPATAIGCVLAIGSHYWTVPYAQLNLPSALYGAGLLLLVVAALALRASGVAGSARIVLTLGATPAVVVVLRLVTDTARDSTTHNLWPLELVIALAIGIAGAAAGALVGRLLASLRASPAATKDVDGR